MLYEVDGVLSPRVRRGAAQYPFLRLPFPLWAIQNQIASALDVVVQHAQLSDGTRRITHITSVEGTHQGAVVLKDVFTFEQRGITKQGVIDGQFVRGNDEPICMPQLHRVTPELVSGLFDQRSASEPGKVDRTMRSTGSRRSKNDPK